MSKITKSNNLDISRFEQINSTNCWALQQIKNKKKLPFACFAEQQTAGRGRRGKHWCMSAKTNIALSLAWQFQLPYAQLAQLPLSIAWSIVDTLESLGLKEVKIKWPNDIYWQDKKMAGILIETVLQKDKKIATVIGVGLNYQLRLDKIKLSQMPLTKENTVDLATAFEQQGVALKTRAVVEDLLLNNMIESCTQYKNKITQLLEKFNDGYDYCKNKTIEIILDNQQVKTGIAMGITEQAELMVSIQGKIQTFNSAEVSIKTKASKV